MSIPRRRGDDCSLKPSSGGDNKLALHCSTLISGSLMLPLLLASGCVAVYEPLAVPANERPQLAAPRLATIAIAVRKPLPTDPVPKRYEAVASVDPAKVIAFRTEDADRLIKRLSDSGFFSIAGYTDEVKGDCVVVVAPTDSPPGSADGDAVMLTGLTLFVFPTIGRTEEGVYFRFEGRNLPEFRCDWPVWGVLGWVAVPLHLSSRWSIRQDEGAFQYHLRQCIQEREDLFLQACPSAGR